MSSILDDLNPCDCPRCGQHESYGCSCTRIEQLEAERDALQAKLDRAVDALQKRDAMRHDNDCGIGKGGYCNCGHTEAVATLAELKGANHDT